MLAKVKIAVVAAVPFPTLQGSQVVVRGFCESLSEKGHEVHLITYGYGQSAYSPRFQIHRIRDFPSYRRFSSGPTLTKLLFDLLLLLKLWRVCRLHGVQLISAHNYEAAVVGAIVGKVSRLPVVYHSHGLLSEELPTYFRSNLLRTFAERFGLFFDRYVPRAATCSLVLTEDEETILQKFGIPPEKIKVIPPGIFLEDFEIPEVPERSPDPRVIYAGNLDSYQNLPLVLEAFKKVIAELPEAKLLIISAGDFTELKKLAEKLAISAKVEFIRATSFERTLATLVAGDIALSARSLRGGFPIKVLNYMAVGLPVVTFKSSATAVKHLHNGYVARDGDLEDYARGMIMLLNDKELRAKLSKNALAEVQNYSWTRIITEVESIYRQILLS
ncbi:MAG: glycosyltransferase family 4 protein [Candidatus Zixiibacteriota bacterium]